MRLFTFYFIFSHYIFISFAQQISLQIPLVSNDEQNIFDLPPVYTSPLTQTQTNAKSFKLKHILHHGVTPSTNKLFRQLNIDDIEKDELTIAANEYVINSLVIDNSKEIGINEENRNHIREVPDHRNKDTVLSMARMSYNAYIELESSKYPWIDLNDWKDSPFGWESDGIRGYVFSDSENKTIVIAIKGTTPFYLPIGGGPIEKNDKFNDNLMFSCCCAKVDLTWKGVCGCYRDGWNCDNSCLHNEVRVGNSYYAIAMKIFNEIKKEHPNANIWLTGHSLGGSLASLLALNDNLPTFAYQAPGELLFAKRLGLDTTNSQYIYHFGHTTDPVFMGECNGRSSFCYHWGYAMETKCHAGSSCAYDTRSKLGWKSEIKNHGIVLFMEQVIDKWFGITEGNEDVAGCFKEEYCEDCQRWNFI